MPTEIQGHGCCRVTKHALHDLDISARTYREGGRGVPQTVRNQPLNADLGAPLDAAGGNGSPAPLISGSGVQSLSSGTIESAKRRRSWHCLGPLDMPLEAKGFRHVAVAIPQVRVGPGIAVSPRQESPQPQQPDLAHSENVVGRCR